MLLLGVREVLVRLPVGLEVIRACETDLKRLVRLHEIEDESEVVRSLGHFDRSIATLAYELLTHRQALDPQQVTELEGLLVRAKQVRKHYE